MIGGYLGNFIIENIKFRSASIESILELHRFMEKTGGLCFIKLWYSLQLQLPNILVYQVTIGHIVYAYDGYAVYTQIGVMKFEILDINL